MVHALLHLDWMWTMGWVTNPVSHSFSWRNDDSVTSCKHPNTTAENRKRSSHHLQTSAVLSGICRRKMSASFTRSHRQLLINVAIAKKERKIIVLQLQLQSQSIWHRLPDWNTFSYTERRFLFTTAVMTGIITTPSSIVIRIGMDEKLHHVLLEHFFTA